MRSGAGSAKAGATTRVAPTNMLALANDLSQYPRSRRSYSELDTTLAPLKHVEEQFIEGEVAPDQTLLVGVAHQRLKSVTVLVGEAVFPRVRAHDSFLLLPRFAVRSERHDPRVCQSFHGKVLGLVKGVEQIDGGPWVLFNDMPFDAQNMHDRENAGLLVKGQFLAAIVWKEAGDPRVVFDQRTDQIGMQQRIDLSVSQHLFDRGVGRHTLDLEIGGRHKFYCLVQLAKPLDRVQRHAVFMLQDAAHPDDGSGLKLFDTDFPVSEIARSAYTLGAVDKNESVAEPAMKKDRDGIYRQIMVAG